MHKSLSDSFWISHLWLLLSWHSSEFNSQAAFELEVFFEVGSNPKRKAISELISVLLSAWVQYVMTWQYVLAGAAQQTGQIYATSLMICIVNFSGVPEMPVRCISNLLSAQQPKYFLTKCLVKFAGSEHQNPSSPVWTSPWNNNLEHKRNVRVLRQFVRWGDTRPGEVQLLEEKAQPRLILRPNNCKVSRQNLDR